MLEETSQFFNMELPLLSPESQPTNQSGVSNDDKYESLRWLGYCIGLLVVTGLLAVLVYLWMTKN